MREPGIVSPVRVGAATELLVAADLIRRGYDVFRNLSGNGTDLILDMNGTLYRVEVRTGVANIPPKTPHDLFVLWDSRTNTITYRPELALLGRRDLGTATKPADPNPS